MTDSHTHLTEDLLLNDTEVIIKRFIEIGGKALLNVGHDQESNLQTLKMAQKYGNDPRLKFKSSIGLHPQLFYKNSHYKSKILTTESLSKNLRILEEQIDRNREKISAIGESGLDYFRLLEDNLMSVQEKEFSIELQKLSFIKHVELAKKYKLPLTIHTRESDGESRCIEDTINILCQVGKGSIRGSFHSFTGSAQSLTTILDLGFFVGFNGIITYKSAQNVRDLLEMTPIERVLFETDAPYLPPQSVRTNKKLQLKIGQPSDLTEIVQIAADVKNLTIDQLQLESDRNFFILFGD